MNATKRFLALAMALVMILPLAACATQSDDPANSGDQTTDAVTEAYDGPVLPEADYGGETFSFYNSCMADWMAINRVTADEE
ncbi:MAG: hypothetical protein IKU90_01405, partial [Clostridia bacterium]|nr:hypothetical protein [Clostridia bacterium]